MNFYIAPLTRQEIASGILFRMGDALDKAFTESAKAITEKGLRGEQEEMLILFENQATNENFYDEHDENIMEVLYLNEAAMSALVDAGLHLKTDGTTSQRPQAVGLMTRMYRFVNLR